MLEMASENEEFRVDALAFKDFLIAFPCYKDIDRDTAPSELLQIVLDAYDNDQLTEEQELVVDLYIHLHHEEAPFDLKRAFDTWDIQDKKAFTAWFLR